MSGLWVWKTSFWHIMVDVRALVYWPEALFGLFLSPHPRHGGGGCDLHRQGAAERHEHLQSSSQGTVVCHKWRTYDLHIVPCKSIHTSELSFALTSQSQALSCFDEIKNLWSWKLCMALSLFFFNNPNGIYLCPSSFIQMPLNKICCNYLHSEIT